MLIMVVVIIANQSYRYDCGLGNVTRKEAVGVEWCVCDDDIKLDNVSVTI